MTALKLPGLNTLFGIPRRKPAYIQQEERIDRNALAKAKRLAAKHDISITRDCAGGWWVCSRLNDTPADPLDGNHFCSDGREVLEATQALVKALT
jgi:hypothetical protein